MSDVTFYTTSFKEFPFFTPKTSQLQRFSLPENIVFYISKTATQIIYQKLFKSCKYFVAKHSFIVATNLSDRALPFTGEQLVITDNASTKILVTGISFYQWFSNDFAKISYKFFYVNIETIFLFNQHLNFTDFLLLVQTGRVKTFTYFLSSIKYKNGNLMEVAEVLEMLPQIEELK